MTNLSIIVTNDVTKIEELVNESGYCPIECSIDGRSITDELCMDHHGKLSHLESVAIRAYRDHFGAKAEEPWFILCGTPDADACFAIAALAGLLPHPTFDTTGMIPPVAKTWTTDWTRLAETVAIIDTNPIGVPMGHLYYSDILMTWNAMSSGQPDSLLAYQGVGLWRTLLTGNPSQLKPFVNASAEAETARRELSLKEMHDKGVQLANHVLLIQESSVFGFPEWYQRNDLKISPTSPWGWANVVVIALTPRGNITIGCPNREVAEATFGKGGLMNVFKLPSFQGWGGREAIGGSPRGAVLTRDEAMAKAREISAMLAPKCANPSWGDGCATCYDGYGKDNCPCHTNK